MRKSLKNALTENKFVEECNEFTCMVKNDNGEKQKVIDHEIQKQVTKNLSALNRTINLIEVPIIGSLMVWIAKHSN